MNILFENQYARTKDFHREIFLYSFFKRPSRVVLHVLLASIFILSILSLLFPGVFPFGNTAVIYLPFWVVVVAVMMIVRYVKTVEISRKRDLEINNGEPVEIKMILTDDGIESFRADSESKIHISYQNIKKIITIRNYYILLTEAKYYIAFKKDGFVTGTPDEFVSFIKSKVIKSVKKSKMRIFLICLACVIVLSAAVSLYITNGRTIFENRAEPTEAESVKIHEIIIFEQAKLSECTELISSYNDRINKLGIEIRPVLEQNRAVNDRGLVVKHDWNKDNWLPRFYSSKIICYVYKDGKRLENRTSYDSISYFVNIYWLLYAGKNENAAYNETPFDYFDTDLDSLLNRVSDFLLK